MVGPLARAPSPAADFLDARRAVQQGIAGAIAKVYSWTMPALTALATLGLLAAILARRRRPAPGALIALTLACAAAVAARVGLLAYVDATSIPAVNMVYLSPAVPFLLMLVALGIYLGLATLRTGARPAEAASRSTSVMPENGR